MIDCVIAEYATVLAPVWIFQVEETNKLAQKDPHGLASAIVLGETLIHITQGINGGDEADPPRQPVNAARIRVSGSTPLHHAIVIHGHPTFVEANDAHVLPKQLEHVLGVKKPADNALGVVAQKLPLLDFAVSHIHDMLQDVPDVLKSDRQVHLASHILPDLLRTPNVPTRLQNF